LNTLKDGGKEGEKEMQIDNTLFVKLQFKKLFDKNGSNRLETCVLWHSEEMLNSLNLYCFLFTDKLVFTKEKKWLPDNNLEFEVYFEEIIVNSEDINNYRFDLELNKHIIDIKTYDYKLNFILYTGERK
jgi:hypothetical protein